jgi:hypothetical protein
LRAKADRKIETVEEKTWAKIGNKPIFALSS